MFATHCDTVRCRERPTHRVRRTFAVLHSRGVVEHETDRELCGGCIECAAEQMYEPATVRGSVELLEG